MSEEFLKCLEEAVGFGNVSRVLSALEGAASVSVRFNPFKLRFTDLGCGTVQVPWSPFGHLLDRRPDFTLDPLFHCGAYYVQDSSAMFVGEVFRRILDGGRVGGRCVRILDLCAAPGGKTTDLASSLRERFGDGFILVANEVMADRAGALSENVAKWGDPCVMVTSADPSAFSSLPGFFDVILADVPCSGEGMFRKDQGALEQWSPENVALCAARQRRIVADVWPALADGGSFIYSTCTFNRLENDGNVEWMLENLDCEPIGVDWTGEVPGWRVLKTDCGFALVPGFVPGEGQYCAAVRKTGSGMAAADSRRAGSEASIKRKNLDFTPQKNNFAAKIRRDGSLTDDMRRCGQWLDVPVELRHNDRGGVLVAVPQTVVAEIEAVRTAVRTLRSGCAVGTVKGGDIVPSADLALCLKAERDAFPQVEVDLDTALSFLHRDSLSLPDAPRGFVLLLYRGLALGFVKNLGSRCNNLYPQSRRIRMDVKKHI